MTCSRDPSRPTGEETPRGATTAPAPQPRGSPMLRRAVPVLTPAPPRAAGHVRRLVTGHLVIYQALSPCM